MDNNYTILYAEDNDEIREKYASFLKSFFTNVHEASNGDDALDIYNKVKPDILLLDINMPGINGLDLAQHIREVDEEVKIMMLTAYSDKEKLLKATELNLSKYFIKPLKTFELENTLNKLIEKLDNSKNDNDFLKISKKFSWDKINHKLYKDDKELSLTKKEMMLLNLFCTNTEKTFSNQEIMSYLWDEQNIDEQNTSKLRVLFSKLKVKTGSDLFQTTYGIGYKIKIE